MSDKICMIELHRTPGTFFEDWVILKSAVERIIGSHNGGEVTVQSVKADRVLFHFHVAEAMLQKLYMDMVDCQDNYEFRFTIHEVVPLKLTYF